MSSDPPSGVPSPRPEGGTVPAAFPETSGPDPELERAAATRERGEELLEVLEAHAPGEGAHARAAGTYAFVAAVACRLGRGRAELIREAAKLHTVGKLYVPAQLLAADRATLGPEDRGRLEAHHEAGAALARGAGVDEEVCGWILHARERFDGAGPGAMAGETIPLESRLIRTACRCASAFAAHPATEAGVAAAHELRERAGGELDPGVAEPLAAMLERTAARAPS